MYLSYLHKNINNIFIRKMLNATMTKRKFIRKNFKIEFGATMTKRNTVCLNKIYLFFGTNIRILIELL